MEEALALQSRAQLTQEVAVPIQAVGDSQAVQRLLGVGSTSAWDTGANSPQGQVATPSLSGVLEMAEKATKGGLTRKAPQKAVAARVSVKLEG